MGGGKGQDGKQSLELAATENKQPEINARCQFTLSEIFFIFRDLLPAPLDEEETLSTPMPLESPGPPLSFHYKT